MIVQNNGRYVRVIGHSTILRGENEITRDYKEQFNLGLNIPLNQRLVDIGELEIVSDPVEAGQ